MIIYKLKYNDAVWTRTINIRRPSRPGRGPRARRGARTAVRSGTSPVQSRVRDCSELYRQCALFQRSRLIDQFIMHDRTHDS